VTAAQEPGDARIDDTPHSIADATERPAEQNKPVRAPRKTGAAAGAAQKTAAVKKAASSTAAAKAAAAKKASEADAERAAAVKKASSTAAAAKSTSRATAARSTAAKTAAAKRTEAAKKAEAAAKKAETAAKKAAADAETTPDATTAGEAPVVKKPAAKRTTAAKTATPKSTTAKTTTAKTTAAKTTAAKTTTPKSAAAKTTTPKTTAAKSASAKTAGTKATASKTTAAKPSSTKTAAVKKPAAKTSATKATAQKSASVPAASATAAAAAELPSDPAVGADELTVVEVTAPAPEVTTDAAIALESEHVPRMVAASNSADLAEARPPRNTVVASATIVDDPVAPGSDDAPATEGASATDETAGDASVATDAPTDEGAPDESAPDEGAPDEGAPDERAPEEGAPEEGAPDDDAPVAREAIRIRGLVKRFGDANAVDNVDLTVPAGSFYGLVGPNGAGKTTTLSIIAGLLRPDAGTVHISGIDQRTDPLEAKRVMGVLPDRLRTFDRLTGRQLLHYYGQLRGLDRAVIEKRTADLARAFDLSEALSRVVSDYSAGMTKKVMLAGALIHSPRVLVLDEPFEAVDPVSSGVILEILRSYVAHGGTVILSSHGMDLVERVCSRVAVIVGGEVLAEGTIDEVRAGQTLTERFIELSGTGGEVEGLEWLHTFSD
jgi:ABC-2 type transport system ATP-binding protein